MSVAILLVALALIGAVSADVITGRCLTAGHTVCPSVSDAPDFCCAPEDQCYRQKLNVSGVILYTRGGCIPRGGVPCPDGHTCAAGQVCCGTKCMPVGANCCGNGTAYCPNGYPCNPDNPTRCAGSIATISPLLILGLLLTYQLLL